MWKIKHSSITPVIAEEINSKIYRERLKVDGDRAIANSFIENLEYNEGTRLTKRKGKCK